MNINSFTDSENTIAISNLKRKFEEKEQMKKTVGTFKGTKLSEDKFWKEVLKKKSRRENIPCIKNLKILEVQS